MKKERKYMFVNNRKVEITDEKNVLQVARNAGVEIPTFCYHSELSVYGACRLCLVEIEGMGMVASCTITPQEGMRVKTHTQEIRETRKTIMELLLANHDQKCTSCIKSSDCKLRELADKIGVGENHYKHTKPEYEMDTISDCLIRDPNKCVLCGDCVRYCEEIQGIGAIDFAGRGENVIVSPAFGQSIAHVDCINCGQCAAVCPTGAIVPKGQIDDVWNVINDVTKTVVAQVAPAVRVALGEMFGYKAGELTIGEMTGVMKMMGFNKVYDTSFAADLTTLEEANEFIQRKQNGGKLPIFTSCCPAWVKYAEQSLPDLLPNLSSCKSPQQMFGSVAKEELPEMLKVDKKDLVVISIMPCTAKKFEARRPEFSKDGVKEVDYVLTTKELGLMIKEAGIMFNEINPESMDLPYGFATGAGVIFGNTGGVTESVLRYVGSLTDSEVYADSDFEDIRGFEGVKETQVTVGDLKLKLAVVHGIKNAKKLTDKIQAGEVEYDIVEVMACPGGCIGGAGQPVTHNEKVRQARAKGIYHADKIMQLHKPDDNPFIKELYTRKLKEPGSSVAHDLLHTKYKMRKRIQTNDIQVMQSENPDAVKVSVCVGTGCFIRGSRKVLTDLTKLVANDPLKDKVNICATFCSENCDKGPTVTIGEDKVYKADADTVMTVLRERINAHS